MGIAGRLTGREPDGESSLLLPTARYLKPFQKTFNFAYIIHFSLGLGYLLPWHAFITAINYFSAIYPDVSVNRTFSVAYTLVALCSLTVIVFYAHVSDAYTRINVGMVLFVAALSVVPVVDAVYIKGRIGLYGGFDVWVGAISSSSLAEGLVQGSLIGSAGKLHERYMQAVVAGTAGSGGVLVSFPRIITKVVHTQDKPGLRKSTNLYFAVGIVVMAMCCILQHCTSPSSYQIRHRFKISGCERGEGGERPSNWGTVEINLLGDYWECKMAWNWNPNGLCCDFGNLSRFYNRGCSF